MRIIVISELKIKKLTAKCLPSNKIYVKELNKFEGLRGFLILNGIILQRYELCGINKERCFKNSKSINFVVKLKIEVLCEVVHYK